MYRKRLMIDEGERSARPPNATGRRSSVLRRAHAVATDDVVKFHLQKLLELLDGQASVTNDRCHCLSIHRIISRYHNAQWSFRHEDMLAVTINMEASFLQRLDSPQMIYAGKLRHQSGRDNFHLANFTARIRFPVEVYVTANRVFDVSKRLFDIRALRMTPRQFRTTH